MTLQACACPLLPTHDVLMALVPSWVCASHGAAHQVGRHRYHRAQVANTETLQWLSSCVWRAAVNTLVMALWAASCWAC